MPAHHEHTIEDLDIELRRLRALRASLRASPSVKTNASLSKATLWATDSFRFDLIRGFKAFPQLNFGMTFDGIIKYLIDWFRTHKSQQTENEDPEPDYEQ